jgi:hypothetical protein
MRVQKSKLLLTAVIAAWLIGVVGGLGLLSNYANAPGIAGTPPQKWPGESQILQATNRATLVMLVHPHCPCSRASMGELARLMTQSEGRVTAYVLFAKPANFAEDLEETDLWAIAGAIPGVTVMRDDDGVEAHRFHAATSGQTILYDEEGTLRFNGGITAGRGHEGDNNGRSAIVSLLTSNKAEHTETPVFGCALFAQDECPDGKEVGDASGSN